METAFTVVDLFAGVGGFSLGFLKANDHVTKFKFDLRLLVDADPTAAYTFKKNYPKTPFWPKTTVWPVALRQLWRLRA